MDSIGVRCLIDLSNRTAQLEFTDRVRRYWFPMDAIKAENITFEMIEAYEGLTFKVAEVHDYNTGKLFGMIEAMVAITGKGRGDIYNFIRVLYTDLESMSGGEV